MNPSSGNLHPTEAHLILPRVKGLEGGVYHYNPLRHALEQRATVADNLWQPLASHFGCQGFLIGFSSIFWESGMIGQVLYLAAEAHGVRGTGIGCFFDDAVHEILGLADNQYQSLYHFTIGKPVEDPRLTTYPPYAYIKDR